MDAFNLADPLAEGAGGMHPLVPASLLQVVPLQDLQIQHYCHTPSIGPHTISYPDYTPQRHTILSKTQNPKILHKKRANSSAIASVLNIRYAIGSGCGIEQAKAMQRDWDLSYPNREIWRKSERFAPRRVSMETLRARGED